MTRLKLSVHESKCAHQIDGIDYVSCLICGHRAKSLKSHVRKSHDIEIKEYIESGGVVLCERSRQKYVKQGSMNGGWYTKKKERGEDLTEYVKKMGNAVRNSIMSNPAERERRSKLMKKLNDDVFSRKEYRKIFSEAAKKTSSRPEILASRSKKLAEWRERCPDEFYDKCVHKMTSFQSIPEKKLREWMKKEFPEHEFTGNSRLFSEQYFLLNKSHKRQIDIISKSKKIIVEFDGPVHFKNIKNWDQLEYVQKKDNELNKSASLLGYVLIRVSYDQFLQKEKDFTEDCREQIRQIVQSCTPGLYLVGSMYDEQY